MTTGDWPEPSPAGSDSSVSGDFQPIHLQVKEFSTFMLDRADAAFIDDLIAANRFKTFLVGTGVLVPVDVLQGLSRLMSEFADDIEGPLSRRARGAADKYDPLKEREEVEKALAALRQKRGARERGQAEKPGAADTVGGYGQTAEATRPAEPPRTSKP